MNDLFRRLVGYVLLSAAIVVLSASDANAYLDPSTGSYFLQLLLAGFLGALFALKVFWRRIKEYIGNLFSDNAKVDRG